MQDGSHSAYGIELSDQERGLVHALAAGEYADLRGARVRAGILRDLVLGRRPGFTLSPAGLRVRGGAIEGTLDLSDARVAIPLVFDAVEWVAPDGEPVLDLTGCHLTRLVLDGCCVGGPVEAVGLSVAHDLTIRKSQIAGAVKLGRARVSGSFCVSDAVVGDRHWAVSASGLAVDGPVIFEDAKCCGGVDFENARFGMGLAAAGLQIVGAQAVLACDGIRLEGAMSIDRAVVEGSVHLTSAHIGGGLSAQDIEVTTVGGGMDMRALTVAGLMRLDRARLKGMLLMDGIDAHKGLSARGIDIDGCEIALRAIAARFGGPFVLSSSRFVGRVDVSGVTAAGGIELSAARIYADDAAVVADGAEVRGSVDMSRSKAVGRISMRRAHLSGRLGMSAATVKVETGCAIDLSGAEFRDGVDFSDGLQTIGAIVLQRADVRGTCDFSGAHARSAAISRDMHRHAETDERIHRPVCRDVDNWDEKAFCFRSARIDHLKLPDRAGIRPRGIVDLRGARLGTLEDAAETWPPAAERRARSHDGRDIDHIRLEDLSYERLANPTGDNRTSASVEVGQAGTRRLGWLGGQPTQTAIAAFDHQPWRQLADYFSRNGREADAEIVRRDLRKRSNSVARATIWQRLAGFLLDVMAGDRRSTLRPLACLALLVALATCVYAWADGQCQPGTCTGGPAFVESGRDGARSAAHSGLAEARNFSPLLFALDRTVPLVRFAPARNWTINFSWAPLSNFHVPNIPVFLTGETDKDRIYASVKITSGGLLYCFELLAGLLGSVFVVLSAASGFNRWRAR